MPKRSPKSSRRKHADSRPSRRPLIWGTLLLTLLAFALLSRSSYSLWLRQTAVGRLRNGAVSDACRYLKRAASSSPNDGRIDMLLAFCYRQLRQPDAWKTAVEQAKNKGTAAPDIELETQLHRIQSGNWTEQTESQLATLAGRGVTSYDVPAAFVSGCLANGRHALAQQILDVWNEDSPHSPHLAYMTGKYWEALGDVSQAREKYQAAISLEPRHELARVALAELYEDNDQLGQALQQYAELANLSSPNEAAALGAARCFRKMGRLERAQAVLEPLSRTSEANRKVAEESGYIAMEQGHLQEAEKWFKRAGVDRTRDPLFLMSAVRLQGLLGDPVEAEKLFQRLAALGDRVTRVRELQTRLTLNPDDTTTAAEIERLRGGLDKEMDALENLSGEVSTDGDALSPGARLFALHCSACHGADGDGDGRAARHLFPRPRNLRWEPSRLVSTRNGAPTIDDTISMLQRGIPGTSMPSYTNLELEELRLLAQEVHRLRREGLLEQYLITLELQGEEVAEEDMEEVREAVTELASPGELIEVPPIPIATSASIVRGNAAYLQLGCATCHGEDGVGGPEQIWYDERGFPVRPRDLTREPFKGGRESASVFLRLAAGMPGTPHPSCTEVSPQELSEVVQFCLSLAQPGAKDLSDHQRAALAATQTYRAFMEAK